MTAQEIINNLSFTGGYITDQILKLTEAELLDFEQLFDKLWPAIGTYRNEMVDRIATQCTLRAIKHFKK